MLSEDRDSRLFAKMIDADPKIMVRAIPAPKGGSRAFCDRMNSWAQDQGQPGLGYIFFRDAGEGVGPIAKNLGPDATVKLRDSLGLESGDAVFFVCGTPQGGNGFRRCCPDQDWSRAGYYRERRLPAVLGG